MKDIKMCIWLFLALVGSCLDITRGAYGTKATFPPDVHFSRLRLTDPLPAVKEFTLCMWTRNDVINGVGTSILSYAVEKNDNELSILSIKKDEDILVRVQIGKSMFNFNCTSKYQKLGKWQHMCVTWFGPDGSTNVYINSESCGDTATLSANEIIKGGGVAVIGQEQDAMDDKYDGNQAWVGDLAELHMWNEVLSNDAIWEAGKCDVTWTNGNIISWLKTPMTAYDGIILSETQLCKS